MTDDEAWSIPPPPFDAAAERQRLHRALRDLKLAERGIGWERGGRRLAEIDPPDPALSGPAASISVRLARRPALTPDWDRTTIRSAADARRWLDDVRRRLARWQDED